MSLASIFAFLSVLVAFGVPQPTIDDIRAILMPSASTTPIVFVPVTTTPITENQPIYFGSVAPVQPVNNPIPAPAPVVVLPPMDKSDVIVTLVDQNNRSGKYGNWLFSFSVLDKDGNYVKQAPVHIDAPDSSDPMTDFVANGESGINKNDWKGYFSYEPTKVGNKTLTFNSGNLTKTFRVNIP